MADPYMILGLSERTSDEEIRQAYLEKIRAFPPDQAPQQFQEIAEAYDRVRDETQRAQRRLFGAPELATVRQMADLIPDAHSARERIGMQAWLKANRETS